MDITLFVKAPGGFFAIMNPFVALPMFLALLMTISLAAISVAMIIAGLQGLIPSLR